MAYSHQKYRPVPVVELPERTWPGRTLGSAPRWCSVDLRDGNQALAEPMGQQKKQELLDVLLRVGFREIELGFPSASQTEFEFVRSVAERRLPADVTPQVITQARRSLIERTFESLKGFPRAIVHLYNSTSEVQRRIVFRKTRKEIVELAVEGTRFVKEMTSRYPGVEVVFQYSPESFTGTELDFALEICEAVTDAWNPSEERKMILNLPSTVENTTPNVFADRIEWFSRNLRRRSEVILSVHAHNDRGTGVATAELAQLAGAERIEGTLLGNGERSGNVDIVTLAMNLYSQGINPELDLSCLSEIIQTVERCTGMSIHPRHPWAGQLVYTAFSGSHQDAIHKGMTARVEQDSAWEVPYLPVDPRDVGRDYEAVIRINSQSGKGGMSHVLERDYGYKIPRAMAVDFSQVVQMVTDQTGEELAPSAIVQLFRNRYASGQGKQAIRGIRISQAGDERIVDAEILTGGTWTAIRGVGGGALEAFANGLRATYPGKWDIVHYTEHARGTGAGAEAVAYVTLGLPNSTELRFGVGEDCDVVAASFDALLIAVKATVEATD
jgi:2-isopropylmalate synthase